MKRPRETRGRFLLGLFYSVGGVGLLQTTFDLVLKSICVPI